MPRYCHNCDCSEPMAFDTVTHTHFCYECETVIKPMRLTPGQNSATLRRGRVSPVLPFGTVHSVIKG